MTSACGFSATRPSRDRQVRSIEPLLVMPRPSNKAYLDFLRKTYEKAQKTGGTGRPEPPRTRRRRAGLRHLFSPSSRSTSGTRPGRTRENSTGSSALAGYVVSPPPDPLRTLLDAKPRRPGRRRLPPRRQSQRVPVQAFRDLEKAENASPGQVDPDEEAVTLVSAARGARRVGPARVLIRRSSRSERKARFNQLNPFYRAELCLCPGGGLPPGRPHRVPGRTRPAVVPRPVRAAALFRRDDWTDRRDRIEAMGSIIASRSRAGLTITNMYETVISYAPVGGARAGARGDLPQDLRRARGLGRRLAGNVPCSERRAARPGHQTASAGTCRSNYWLTIHVLHRGFQLRGFPAGGRAGADRDALLPDRDLPPFGQLHGAGPPLGSWHPPLLATGAFGTQWATNDLLSTFSRSWEGSEE